MTCYKLQLQMTSVLQPRFCGI